MDYVAENKFRTKEETEREEKLQMLGEEILKEILCECEQE